MKAKTWNNCFIIMDNTKYMFFTKGRRLKVFENLKIRPSPSSQRIYNFCWPWPRYVHVLEPSSVQFSSLYGLVQELSKFKVTFSSRQ